MRPSWRDLSLQHKWTHTLWVTLLAFKRPCRQGGAYCVTVESRTQHKCTGSTRKDLALWLCTPTGKSQMHSLPSAKSNRDAWSGHQVAPIPTLQFHKRYAHDLGGFSQSCRVGSYDPHGSQRQTLACPSHTAVGWYSLTSNAGLLPLKASRNQTAT